MIAIRRCLRHVLRFARCAGAIVSLGAMAVGCGDAPSRPTTTVVKPTQDTIGVGVYLDTMNRLANGTPTQQADTFYEVEREYTSAPTTANSLRYAVALVTPGHPSTNLVQGKKVLEQLLANPEKLIAVERSLAAVLVKEADIHLQLQAENRRLTATVDERARSQANFDRRAQTLAEENTRLHRLLDEAQQKLNAIKSIERSIIERSSQPTPATGSRDVPNREPSQTQSTSPSR